MKKLVWLTTTYCLLIATVVQAQSFRYRASVDAVQQSGYHKILLSPDVVGRLNANLTDIRLYDGQQQEVPYLLARQQPTQTSPFVNYDVVSRKSIPNVATKLVVRNPSKSQISSFELVIKNTNVGKKARLSGSSDAQNWYALDDNLWLGPSQNNLGTTETKTINFPISDYEYYQLDINDSLGTPLNILKAGHYVQKAIAGSYLVIPNLSISQRDSSDKNTYVHLTRTTDARFDKLTIAVQTSAPFRRRAILGQFHTRKLKRGRIERWFESIRSFELTSTDSNVVHLPGLKTNDLYLVIANDDNPPLRVRDVQAYQLTTYLVANLTANSSYQLRFSADDVVAPAYDLTAFKTTSPKNPPVIGVSAITAIDSDSESTASLCTDSRIIWPALGLVLLVLGILSYRMLREMGKTNG